MFDSHAHLDDQQFAESRDDVIRRASDAGLTGIVAVGTTADSSQVCIQLAKRYPLVFAAVGIQPNYCAEAESADWDRAVSMTHENKVVAIGETGLDRYWDYTPFGLQQDYFDRHLRLSQQSGLPFIVHMRDCMEDILVMLREARGRGTLHGVMHSYTGDAEAASECVDLGLYISFAGMVTFKKSEQLRQIAAGIPEDRILIETDAPYLSPHPKRGQRPNEPALIVHTAACLAATRNLSVDEFARLTTENARQFFRLGAV